MKQIQMKSFISKLNFKILQVSGQNVFNHQKME